MIKRSIKFKPSSQVTLNQILINNLQCDAPNPKGNYLFLFFSNTPQIQYKTTFLLQGHMKPGETLPELHLLYKMNLITTMFFLHKQKLGFSTQNL